MNLSPMMYRLNHAQGQKLPLATEQQQQQPQQQQQQHPAQQQQHQIIPSHVVLQQQLDAVAANASTNTPIGNSTTSNNQSVNLHSANVFVNNFSETTITAETDKATTTTTTSRHLLHIQQQHQQQQQPPPPSSHLSRHLNHHPQNIVISATSSAAPPATTAAVVDSLSSSSIEENFKLLKTAIKSEPLHDTSSSTSNLNNVLNANSKEDIISLAACSSLANVIPSSSLLSSSSSSSSSSLLTTTSAKSSALKNSLTLSNVVSAAATQVGNAGSGTGEAITTANGSLGFVPSKRARLELREEWISTPSPGSVPSTAPLSPSSASQNHMYGANMSNGYASPMSAGSYDPFSPNGKTGT